MRENRSCSKMEVLAPKVMSLPLLIPQLYRADWQCESDSEAAA